MSIEDFFSSTAKIFTRGPSDEYGEASFVEGAAFPCRFDPKMSNVKIGDDQEDVLIDGFVYMLPANKPEEGDEIEVDGVRFRLVMPVGVTEQREFGDVHHIKVGVRKVP